MSSAYEVTTIMLVQWWWVAALKANPVLLANLGDYVYGLKAAKNTAHPCAALAMEAPHDVRTANGRIIWSDDIFQSLIIAPDVVPSQIDYLAAEMHKALHKVPAYTPVMYPDTAVQKGMIVSCIKTANADRQTSDDDVEWVYRGGLYQIPARVV